MACALLLCGCASQKTGSAEKANLAIAVKNILDSKKYEISVNTMYPTSGAITRVSSYFVRVDGKTLISYLPYIGESHGMQFGQTKGLNFEAPISEYSVTYPKADRRTIQISTKNEEDSYGYTLTIFNNGKADIFVRPRNSSPISYSGILVME